MKNAISIKRKALFCLIIGVTFFSTFAKAQTPIKCLEIESELVDACGSPEGENEMIIFKIGPSAINVSDLNITWPNNSFLGISPANALTASIVATLNASIVSCGRLIEPTAGILPAGKSILLVTSTAMSTSANSFATLTDTLYIIFQNAGNTAGHFVNYSAIPGLRTTIIQQISTGCSDSVTYDKSQLVNQLGGHGGTAALNDGATVLFSWPGFPTPSYVNNGCMAPFVPITSDAGTGSTVCAGTSINLTGTATGNYSSVIWQSSGGGSFSNPNSLTTTYTAPSGAGTVTLSLGVIGHCHDTVYSTINMNVTTIPSPVISASGSTTICAGNSVTLTASGGSSYAWNTGASTNSISVSTSGTYTVTATNSCGSQTATQSVNVTPLPAATINSSSTAVCSGGSLLLWATGIGNFVWSDGDNNDSTVITSGGTYFVSATNSCGSANDTITISTLPLPSPSIALSGSSSICTGDSVILTATGGSTYVWNTGSVSPSITVSSAGTYTVTASNSCGSVPATTTITVNTFPTASINSIDTTVCSGNTLLLWATGTGNYSWSTGESNDSIYVSAGGNYILTSTGSCGVASDSITITQQPLPVAAIASVGSTTICNGSSVTLNGSGGTNYIWQPSGSIASSISATTAGTYTLTASNNCGSDAATITVSVISSPTATITSSGSTTICVGDNLTLNANGGGTYLWSNGSTANSINVTDQGTYWVIVSNTCGTDTASTIINADSVTALFTSNTISGVYPLPVNFTNNSSSNAITYFWSFGDGNSSSLFSPANTFQTPGTYTVTLTVTNSNGCSDTYSIQIIVLETPSTFSIPNVFSPNGDANNDVFFVSGTGIKEFECTIFDRWGLKIAELNSISEGWDGRTTAGVTASDGTYYYIIKATGLDNKIYDKTGFILLSR